MDPLSRLQFEHAVAFLRNAFDLVVVRQRLVAETGTSLFRATQRGAVPAAGLRDNVPLFAVVAGGGPLEKLDGKRQELENRDENDTRSLFSTIRTLRSLSRENALFRDDARSEFPRIVAELVQKAVGLLEEVEDTLKEAKRRLAKRRRVQEIVYKI